MTVKLYDQNSHATEFEAVVIKCEKNPSGYRVELDRTLFFPEEGGQCSDRGILGGVNVISAQIEGDTIWHNTDAPLEPGSTVNGQIDFALRFRNMQNHSGEHIICGIAHKLFGCENVGFHLGEDCVTMDLDCELTEENISLIEQLANEAVARNLPVTAYYPEKEELRSLTFRAKGEIEGRVRIVTIGDVDSCACCAPHVSQTGEIGIIKITDSMRHRGGMRFTIKCGSDALADYAVRLLATKEISNLLSVKQHETVQGVRKLLDDVAALRTKLGEKNRRMAELIASSVQPTSSDICIFCDDFEPEQLRSLANAIKEKTPGFVTAVCGCDCAGYKYVIVSESNDVADYVRSANSALGGRGGGRQNMASGSFAASEEAIKKYFESSALYGR